jgi:murein DD-endopeptidase MepM/ murein hydrolase activator NlpD
MKDSILVTITTLKGSKQYTITQLLKRFMIAISLFIVFTFVILFFIINYLNKVINEKTMALSKTNQDMKHIINQKNRLQAKLYVLQNHIVVLENNISKKEKILSEVNDKLADIERIIQFTPPKDMKITERVDLAKLDLEDKHFILNNIPNGYPVPYIGISSKFGWRIHPILHKREFHTGLDLRAKLNTPVVAPADGIVEFAAYHKRSGYGNLLIIDHNFGFKTMYGHLNKIIVKSGSFVKKGQVVAYTGNSGLSNGPHLHYEIRYIGMVLNPYYFIKWNLKNYNYIFKKERKVKWQSLIKAIQWQKKLIQQQ